jgi:hypothetical protein
MALGTFTPPPSKTASSFDPREKHGRPLIVVPREFLENHVTKKYPQPRDKVVADVVDLLSDTVVISVLWGSGAIVDRLKDSCTRAVPTPDEAKLPVKIVKVAPSGGGNEYFSIESLEGKELQLAAAWDAKNPTRIDDERTAREAADKAEAAAKAGNGSTQEQAPLAGISAASAAAPAAAEAPASGGLSDDALEAALAALG